jgi:acetyl esterase/lipase
MHTALRVAGVEADLYVAEAMPHSGFGGMSPEDNAARADTVRWLQKHWRVSNSGPA